MVFQINVSGKKISKATLTDFISFLFSISNYLDCCRKEMLRFCVFANQRTQKLESDTLLIPLLWDFKQKSIY